MPVNFFNPTLAVDAGFIEGDYRVIDAYIAHQSWAKKDGSNPKNTQDSTVMFLELKNLNADPHSEPHRELYIIGGKDAYIPSPDGVTPLPQSPRRTSQDVIPVAERASFIIEGPKLYRHTGAFIFLNELGMTGFPMDKIYEQGVKALIGVEGHMRPEGKEKVAGAIEKPKAPGDRDERLTPVFKKILRLPWDSNGTAPTPASAQAAAGVHTAPPAAAPATTQSPALTADRTTLKAATRCLSHVLAEDAKKQDTEIEDTKDLKNRLTKILLNNTELKVFKDDKGEYSNAEPAFRNEIFKAALNVAFFTEVTASIADEIGFTYALDASGDIKRKK